MKRIFKKALHFGEGLRILNPSLSRFGISTKLLLSIVVCASVFWIWIFDVFGERINSRISHPIEFGLRAILGFEPKLSDKIKIYSFDDSTLNYVKSIGLPIHFWGKLFAAISDAGANKIIIDKIFSMPQALKKAGVFVERMDKTDGFVVIAASFLREESIEARKPIDPEAYYFTAPFLFTNEPRFDEIDWLPSNPMFAYGPHENIIKGFRRLGHVLYEGTGYVDLLKRISDRHIVPHLSLQYNDMIHIEPDEIRLDNATLHAVDSGRMLVNLLSYEEISSQTIAMKSAIARVQYKLPFDDVIEPGQTIVILPNMYTGSTDMVETATGLRPGGHVIVSMVNSMASGEWLQWSPYSRLLLFFAIVFPVYLVRLGSQIKCLIGLSVFILVIVAGGLSLFVFANTVTPWALMSFSGSTTGLLLFSIRLRVNEKQILRDKIEESEIRNKLLKERERLHGELQVYVGHVEELVEEKTQHINSVMTHIKQGIFNILPGPKIENDYSKFLEEIVGQKNFAGEDPLSFVFSKSSLGVDEVETLGGSLRASLGKNKFNFMLNSNHFPAQFEFEKRYLEISWQMIEKANMCEKIMVVMRDVTQLRLLEEQKKSSQEEMDRIREILGISKGRCQDFFTEAENLLSDVETSFKSLNDNEIDPSSIDSVFRIYHTLKGLARGVGFKQLSNAIHTAENLWASLRDDISGWNFSQAQEEYGVIIDSLDNYMHTSNDTLGRDSKGGSLSADLVQSGIRMFGEMSGNLRGKYLDFEKSLRDLYFRSLNETISEVFEENKGLAESLKKATPHLNFEGSDVDLNPEGVSLIKNIFVHLVRNSIDHGIETESSRIEKGKEAHGSILVSTEEGRDSLQIHFKDDGGGLNLNFLKKIATDKGILPKEESDPLEISQVIFKPGFSTSEEVTDISGRGVGMDAVRSFTEKAGCDLELNLIGSPNEDSAVPFEFVLTLNEKLYEPRKIA